MEDGSRNNRVWFATTVGKLAASDLSAVCLQAKQVNKIFKSAQQEFLATQPAQRLSLDLSFWPVPNVNVYKVLLVIADQFSKFTYDVPLTGKSPHEGNAIQQCIPLVESICHIPLSVVHAH